MAKQNTTSLFNFKHRIVLSKSFTEPLFDKSTDIILFRKEVMEVWASINPVRGSFYVNGFAMQENRNAYSHNIFIRFNRALDITGYAWLYEKRNSGGRWYKVLAVQEMNERERFWQIEARLTQKGDDVNPPGDKNSKFAALPEGAKL